MFLTSTVFLIGLNQLNGMEADFENRSDYEHIDEEYATLEDRGKLIDAKFANGEFRAYFLNALTDLRKKLWDAQPAMLASARALLLTQYRKGGGKTGLDLQIFVNGDEKTKGLIEDYKSQAVKSATVFELLELVRTALDPQLPDPVE